MMNQKKIQKKRKILLAQSVKTQYNRVNYPHSIAVSINIALIVSKSGSLTQQAHALNVKNKLKDCDT